MSKSKQTINEDISGISRLMNYSRGLTSVENEVLFENTNNKKKVIQEQIPPAIAGAGPLLGTAAVLTALWKTWDWVKSTWGSKDLETRVEWALKPDTWDKLLDTINKTEVQLGESKVVQKDLSVISKQKAQTIAAELEQIMNDFIYKEKLNNDGYKLVIKQMLKLSSFVDLARVSSLFGERYKKVGAVRGAADYFGGMFDDDDEETELMNLQGFFDMAMSKQGFKDSIEAVMETKPIVVFKKTQYDVIDGFIEALAALVKDKKDSEEYDKGAPARLAQIKEDLILMMKGKFGDCVVEDLEAAELKFFKHKTTGKDTYYFNVITPTGTLRVYRDGRTREINNNIRGALGMLSKCNAINESWAFKSPLVEELIYKNDGSNDNKVINPKDNTDDSNNTPIVKKPKRSGQKYVRVTYTFDELKNGDETAKVGDVNKDEAGAIYQIQKLIGSKADGVYGPNTKRAVETFQRRKGLDVTGIFGVEESALDTTGGVATEVITVDKMQQMDNTASNAAEVITNNEIVQAKKEITSSDNATETLKHLKDLRDEKLDKPTCIQLVVAANAALPNLVPEILPKLQACFYDFNFPLRIGRRAVKKRYGITGKGRKK